MKNLKSLIASLLLIILLALAILPATAAGNTTLVYSTESNSGTRHVECTTLEGTHVGSYYTGSNTYENLSQLAGDTLYNRLNTLMTSTHKKISTYGNCRDMAVKTDCEEGDGRVNLIYTSYSATFGDYGGNTGTWNREHVWPKSLGGFNTDGPGADLHHIRPSDATANSRRGNKLYGDVTNGSAVYASSLVGKSVIAGYSSGNYFEPLDNVKGDVARICLYLYVRYGKSSSYDCDSINNVFRDVDTLLAWCELDPVDTWEMGRNEVVSAYQGNRNVFIDYPELAWRLFSKDVPETMTTPSGAASGDIEDTVITPPTCLHTEVRLRGVRAATCNKEGYTGDRYCPTCDKVLAFGTVTPKTDTHIYQWNEEADADVCVLCGHTEPKNNTTVVVICVVSAVAVVGVGTAVTIVVIKKKKKRV